MKKVYLLILFLILSKISFCDIIPDNSHYVNKCVKIINTKDFPDYVLLALVKHPAGENINAYIINPNLCLDKGYKFSTLYVSAVKKSYLAGKHLDSIDWKQDKNVLKANIHIESYGGYVSNASPVSSIEEFFRIAAFTDTSVIIYKCNEVIKFSDGRPLSTKAHPYEEGSTQIDSTINTPSTDYFADELHPNVEMSEFLKALLLTILTEIIVLLILFKTKLRTENVRTGLLLLTGILASSLTLPYVWFILPNFIEATLLYVSASELSVIIIESFIIFLLLKINYKKALVVSFTCNLTSFLVGLIVSWVN